MSENLRNASIAIFFALLSVFTILLYPKVSVILSNLEEASKHSAVVSKRLNDFLTPEMLKNYDNNLNTSTLTLQQMANDYAGVARDTRDSLRIITAEVKPTLRSADRLIARAADETLPKLNRSIDSSDRLINSAVRLTDAGELAIGETKLTIAQVRALLSDPNIVELLAESAQTAKEVHLTAAEVRQAIPELLAELNKIEANVARGTGETADFIAGFNKPEGKTSKVAKFILSALLGNIRSLRP